MKSAALRYKFLFFLGLTEAVYNAIFKATTVTSARGELKAVPIERVKTILEKYNALHWDTNLESPNRDC